MDISRRNFLIGSAGLLATSLMPWRFALADAPGDRRLVVIVLRGAMDGLAAVVPLREGNYHNLRGDVAAEFNDTDLIALNSDFALAAALSPLDQLYKQGQMLFVHGCAWPSHTRSHFDAQDMLENGGLTPHLLQTGWLNRTLGVLRGPTPALALGSSIPLLLRGDAAVTSWEPSNLPEVDADFLSRVQQMYGSDPVLSNALNESEALKTAAGDDMTMGNGKGSGQFAGLMEKLANFMGPQGQSRIASIDLGGWDTHVGQKGRLARNFAELAQGIDSFRQQMGAAWGNSAVLCLTEFGRTARGNGTNGTDHGTGSVAFLVGGAVKGGQMAGDWPGLGRLFDNRDLMPANDMRRLLKGVLMEHLGIEETMLDSVVFPDSRDTKPFRGLMRA